mgnify:FL=1
MNNNTLDTEKLIGISALFVHAAKIDGNYTEKEKKIIKSFLKNFDQNDSVIENILLKAEKLENNTNQLLSFTNLIKKKFFRI